jgi:hypothetical protein
MQGGRGEGGGGRGLMARHMLAAYLLLDIYTGPLGLALTLDFPRPCTLQKTLPLT